MRLTTFLIALGLALLAGCSTPGGVRKKDADILTPDTILKKTPVAPPEDIVSSIAISPETDANRKLPPPEIEVGSGKFFTVQPRKAESGGEGQVTFNFESQPVQAVVKAILGDMLQENYTIAPNVSGNVTYSTSRPIRREDAMPVLEMLLPTIAYVVAIHFLGIYVSSAIFIAAFMVWQGRYRIVTAVGIGVTIPVLLFALFEIWFLVPLPKGPLERMLGY